MVNTKQNYNNIEAYRKLDFDDLSILTLMGENITRNDISIYLYLTPPAICHRLKKYSLIWPNMFRLEGRNKNKIITEEGFDICKKMKGIVYFLLDLSPNESYKTLIERSINKNMQII